MLGAGQSGARSSLRLLRLLRDEDLIREARARGGRPRRATTRLLAEHPALRQAVLDLLDADRADLPREGLTASVAAR